MTGTEENRSYLVEPGWGLVAWSVLALVLAIAVIATVVVLVRRRRR